MWKHDALSNKQQRRSTHVSPVTIPLAHAYHTFMWFPERTVRQRMMDLLIHARRSSHQLAQLLGIPERQVEDHLTHVVKSLARNRTRRFILDPAACPDCGFVFRDRRKLTKPSRCPSCRSEGITAPRYGIEPTNGRPEPLDSRPANE
ncbi:MAG: hypothetical protein OEY28_05515 [Nitrospira sp.]|nr:hypothetical protein [Nitrospira sp.]